MKPESSKFTTFISTLKLTASPNDGEALAAIRAANKLLQQFGGDWDALLRGRVTLIADPFTSIPTPEAATPSSNTYRNPTPPPRPAPPPPPRPQSPPRFQNAWSQQAPRSNIYGSANPPPRAAASPQPTPPPKPNQWTHSGSPAARPLHQAPKHIRKRGPRRPTTDDLAL